jgi:hypothetical protein
VCTRAVMHSKYKLLVDESTSVIIRLLIAPTALSPLYYRYIMHLLNFYIPTEEISV